MYLDYLVLILLLAWIGHHSVPVQTKLFFTLICSSVINILFFYTMI